MNHDLMNPVQSFRTSPLKMLIQMILSYLFTGFIAAPLVEFHPLNYVQWKRISTEVFKLDFDINEPDVQYVKCGSTLTEKSSHLVKMAGDGHCFFCSISFLLTGNQFHHYKICQHLCDFIESEDNWSKLRAFLGTTRLVRIMSYHPK